jgi:hypothetical protein
MKLRVKRRPFFEKKTEVKHGEGRLDAASDDCHTTASDSQLVTSIPALTAGHV